MAREEVPLSSKLAAEFIGTFFLLATKTVKTINKTVFEKKTALKQDRNRTRKNIGFRIEIAKTMIFSITIANTLGK